MGEKIYNKLADSIRNTAYGQKIIIALDRLIVMLAVVSYMLIIISQIVTRSWIMLYHMILVPAAGFMVVSMCRYIYNRPRPYEVMDIEPLIPKLTKGKSFPSRHVYSIFIIAITAMQVSVWAGALLIVLGMILSVVRVIGGVHFIRDVVSAGFLGVLTGLVGYYMLLS